MIPIERTVHNIHLLLSTLCDTKYRANVRAFFIDIDAWSDATDGDTNNGSLDSGVGGVRLLRYGIVKLG